MNTKSEKNETLIIIGKSGSGKSYLLSQLSASLPLGVKSTTRPPRINEVNGKDNYFITDDEFQKNIDDKNFMFTQTYYNKDGHKWQYGLLKTEFEKGQLFIFTPKELKILDDLQRPKCFVVYLDIDIEIRRSRLNKRNDMNDSIDRRIEADELDFMNFKDYDLKITDPEFDTTLILSLMF